MISSYSKLAQIEPIKDLGFDFTAKAAMYKSQKIEQNFGQLQSYANNIAKNVDIVRQSDREYFDEKMKGVVNSINQFKNLDLTDTSTVYQFESMLEDVLRDPQISSSIVDTANFRNVQKQMDMMRTNPKYADLIDPALFAYDERLMQNYLMNPSARFTQQNASINPKLHEQFDINFKNIQEEKRVSINGDDIVTTTVKDKLKLEQAAYNTMMLPKNQEYLTKVYSVTYDLENNPQRAISGIGVMLNSQKDYYKSLLTEAESAANSTNDIAKYKPTIDYYKEIVQQLDNHLAVVKEGKDLGLINQIGFNAFTSNLSSQQSQRGYSYTSGLKMSDASKIKYALEKEGLLMDRKNQYDLAKTQLEFGLQSQRDATLHQFNLERDAYNNQADLNQKIAGGIMSGKTSSGNIMNSTGNNLTMDTVPLSQTIQNKKYYEIFTKELDDIKKEKISLQGDLLTLLTEASVTNPKISAVLQKYPNLKTLPLGEKALMSMLTSMNIISSASGTRLEPGASLNGVMTIMNKIKENNIRYNFKSNDFEAKKSSIGKDVDTFNESYKNGQYGDTVFDWGISLQRLNDISTKDKSFYDPLVSSIMNSARRGGALSDSKGKALDEEDASKIMNSIDFSKSEKGVLDVNNMRISIIPRNSKGETLLDSDSKEMYIAIDSDFLNKVRNIYPNGQQLFENLNKPNTNLDYYIQQPNNSKYVERLKQSSFYVDATKVPEMLPNTVLEYKYVNVRQPINSIGRGYNYDVAFQIGGQSYSMNVSSTDELNHKLNEIAKEAKRQVGVYFTQKQATPSKSEVESKVHEYFIKILKNGKP